MSSSRFSVTIAGLNELRAQGVSAPGLYTAKLVGWSEEETAVGTFSWLADAISWLEQALKDGALVIKRVNIYSAKDELVWTVPGAPSAQMLENVMKQNAKRVLVQLADIGPSELQDTIGNAGVAALESPDRQLSL